MVLTVIVVIDVTDIVAIYVVVGVVCDDVVNKLFLKIDVVDGSIVVFHAVTVDNEVVVIVNVSRFLMMFLLLILLPSMLLIFIIIFVFLNIDLIVLLLGFFFWCCYSWSFQGTLYNPPISTYIKKTNKNKKQTMANPP